MANLDLSVDVVESFAQTLTLAPQFIDLGVVVNPKLYIAGTLVNDKFMMITGRFQLHLNGRGGGNFTLTNPAKDYRPTGGDPVLLTNNGVVLFAGTVQSAREYYEGGKNIRRFECRCVDYAASLDRRFITGELKNATLGVENVVRNLLVQNQIKPGAGSSATDINEVIFIPNAISSPIVPGFPRHLLDPCTQAMRRYADMTGYTFFVDENRNMIWRDHAAAPDPAPWDITNDATGRKNHQRLDVERDIGQKANAVYVRTKLALASTIEESFVGDGSQKNFTLKATPSQVISVTVNGASQTFGTLEEKLGLDVNCISTLGQTYKQWYYFPPSTCLGFGSRILEQHDAETPIANGAVLTVTYRGPVSNFAFAEDTSDQAARAAIEGGTGKYEAVFEEPNVADPDMAQALADAFLAKHLVAEVKVKVYTQKHGLRPGQTITIVDPDFNLNGDFLIQSVSLDFQAGTRIQYEAECVASTLPIPRPEQFLEKLVEMARLGSDAAFESSAGNGLPGGGSGGGVPIWERPRGIVDGTNDTFYTTYLPQELETEGRSIIAIVAGRMMYPFDDTDYTVTVSEGKIVYASGTKPQAGDDHHVIYYRQDGASIGNPNIGARLFAGGTDIIDWGAHSAHFIQGDLSIGLWIKLNSSTANNQTLITRGVGDGSITQYGLQVSDTNGQWGILYFHDTAGNQAQTIEYDLDLAEDTWYYIGISRNVTTKTVLLYVGDGNNIIRSVFGSYPLPPGGSDTGTRNLGVGGGFGTFGGVHLQGTIQEHYISSRSNPWNIDEHKAAMKGSPPASGLVLSVRLLGASPEVDESSTGATGTVTGTTAVPGRI